MNTAILRTYGKIQNNTVMLISAINRDDKDGVFWGFFLLYNVKCM